MYSMYVHVYFNYSSTDTLDKNNPMVSISRIENEYEKPQAETSHQTSTTAEEHYTMTDVESNADFSTNSKQCDASDKSPSQVRQLY